MRVSDSPHSVEIPARGGVGGLTPPHGRFRGSQVLEGCFAEADYLDNLTRDGLFVGPIDL